MEYVISDRMKDIKGSVIRDLFKKAADDPEVIALGGGNPSADSFPVQEIREIAESALREKPVQMLQYGLSEGYTPLRNTIRKKLSEDGFDFEKNDVIIVSGAQQACDIASKVIVNEGDKVIAEDPSFIGCLNTFRSYNARILGIPMEDDGMSMDVLEKTLKENPDAKLIYTIPSFQNPTGITMSLQKRKRLLSLAEKYNVMIFEDNPYGVLRFKGENIPTLKSMDKDGRVIYAGSFSKVMAPAFRVGYMIAPKEYMEKLYVAKQTTDVHTTVLFQYICDEFINKYDYDGHVEAIRKIYGHKCEVMLSAMEKYFHPDVWFSRPEGGLFIMARLPYNMDSAPFVQKAIDKKVFVIPGNAFCVRNDGICSTFRMNYSCETDENIIKGIRLLGEMTYDVIEREKGRA